MRRMLHTCNIILFTEQITQLPPITKVLNSGIVVKNIKSAQFGDNPSRTGGTVRRMPPLRGGQGNPLVVGCFSTLLYWLLFFALFGAGVWVLLESRRRLSPPALADGTEQMLSVWSQSVRAYHQEVGQMPDEVLHPWLTQETRNSQLMEALAGANRLRKSFIVPRAVLRKDMIPIDAWGRALHFDPDHTGDLSKVVSAGLDGRFGTGDDISSETARKRNIPLPPE
jgi:hypothetical protein